MAAEYKAEVHLGALRCLLGLFDAATGDLAGWTEFDAETERWGVEVRALSREELRALIESSTREIPTTEHRRLHQEASDFVRQGRRGGRRTLALYGRPAVLLVARPLQVGAGRSRNPNRAPCWEFKGPGRCDPPPRV